MCRHPKLENIVVEEVKSHSNKSKLNKFETPAAIKLAPEVWTPDTDFVTAALKLKRKSIQNHYQHLIDSMYS